VCMWCFLPLPLLFVFPCTCNKCSSYTMIHIVFWKINQNLMRNDCFDKKKMHVQFCISMFFCQYNFYVINRIDNHVKISKCITWCSVAENLKIRARWGQLLDKGDVWCFHSKCNKI
jgi:hypothetical protein